MSKLRQLLSAPLQLWRQQREIAQLHEEVAKLRAQNDSMRQGMRRCVSCEYRIDFKQRQDNAVTIEPPTVTQPFDHTK